ncbi:unnamed protein product [Rangifer tarandus platyrhynchus]|uniref:Uncharacterized protein n=2 Tax=Rangifer tarandus platyrhynchus TaxID=3082113 RepID=A0ABN8YTN4_RANTA|nr:unnamed protein product [Rangifer tarandus platyrhynchus]CAI9702515.1 unnamed protein product [Rangifer tarandus platyrhynchus]
MCSEAAASRVSSDQQSLQILSPRGLTALKAGVRSAGVTAGCAVRLPPTSLLPRRNCWSAPPAVQLRLASDRRRPHPSPRSPAPQHALQAGAPPLPSLFKPQLYAPVTVFAAVVGSHLAGEVRSQLLAVVRKGKSGSCHARSCPAPQGARAGEGVLSWPPAWGGIGAPLEGAAAGEPAAARAVSVFRLARPRSCWVWRVGSVLRLQTPKAAPFPGGTETHDVGGVPGRDAGGVGGPRIGSDLQPGEDGLRHRRPRAARLLRTPCRIPAGVLLPWFPLGEALGAAAGPPRTFLSRVRVCVRACVFVCVWPGLSPGRIPREPPSPPARSRPFHVASTWSLQVPLEFTAGVWGPGRVHIWTHGHVLLTAAFRRRKFVPILWDMFSYYL